MCRHNMQPSMFRPISPNEFGIKQLSIYIYIYIYYLMCLAPAKIGNTRIFTNKHGHVLGSYHFKRFQGHGKGKISFMVLSRTPLQMLQKHGFLTQYLLELALVDSQMLRPAVPEGNIFSWRSQETHQLKCKSHGKSHGKSPWQKPWCGGGVDFPKQPSGR